MKSAYELALERMEKQGIAPPREDALDAGTRDAIAEVRRRAEAKLAELEILHRDRARSLHDGAARSQEDDEYQRDRRRIEARCDTDIARLRDETKSG